MRLLSRQIVGVGNYGHSYWGITVALIDELGMLLGDDLMLGGKEVFQAYLRIT